MTLKGSRKQTPTPQLKRVKLDKEGNIVGGLILTFNGRADKGIL